MSEFRTSILCKNCCCRVAVCTCGAYSEKEKLETRILELEGDVKLRREEWKKESKENDKLRLKIEELENKIRAYIKADLSGLNQKLQEEVQRLKRRKIMNDFETILVKAGELTYKEIPFEGINTSQHFIPKNTLEEIKKIKPKLDEELAILEKAKVINYQLKDTAKKKILVVRKITPEIAKILGLVAGATSAVFVSPHPIKSEITKKYEFGVFGYKSIIVTERREK